ncbi:MAG: hypothetical protein ABS73_13515 [Paracoccus sp. SCN 68-21]|nr:MAG: hypothetical protein ABS73_13515 [Paracoccus sp. SCN 68-21]
MTAAAALWLRAEPALSAADLARRLTERAEDLGEPGRDEVFGAGLLQAPPSCTGPGRVGPQNGGSATGADQAGPDLAGGEINRAIAE